MKLHLLTGGLALIAAISLGTNIWQHKFIESLELKPASFKSDEPYIQKAEIYWAQKDGTTVIKAMDCRYGKVIYFAEWICVSLEIEAGGVGGVPVYCFDERSGQLKNRYDDVE